MIKKLISGIILCTIMLSPIGSKLNIKAETNSVIQNLDVHIRKKLLKVLDKTESYQLTYDDLKSIKEITFSTNDWIDYKDMTFSGIELLENLEYLSFDSVVIKSLENVKGLNKLKELHIKESFINNFDEIREMTHLKKISAVRNYVLNDFLALEEITSLESLEIRGNYIKSNYPNFSKLKNLKELKIEISKGLSNELLQHSISNEIETLELYFLDEAPTSFLIQMPNIKYLTIDGWFNGDLRYIGELLKLEKFHVKPYMSKKTLDMSYLANLSDLKHLDVRYQELINENYISNFRQLSYLDISNVVIKDKSFLFLEDLNQLEYLNISETFIANLNPLVSLTKLKKLVAETNDLVDISPISSLENLVYLSLDNNKIVDLTPIASLKNVKELKLENNKIIDLKGIDGIEILEKLYFGYNQVKNIDILVANQNLQVIDMPRNRIKDTSILQSMQNLYAIYGYGQKNDFEVLWGGELIFDFIEYGNFKENPIKEFTEDGKYTITYLKGIVVHPEDLESLDSHAITRYSFEVMDTQASRSVPIDHVEVNQEDIDRIKENPVYNHTYTVRALLIIEGNTYQIEYMVAPYNYAAGINRDYFHLLRKMTVPSVADTGGEIYSYDEKRKVFKGESIGVAPYFFRSIDYSFSGEGHIIVIPSKLEVQYVDTFGVELAQSVTYEGKLNTEQHLEMKAFEGYDLISGPKDNQAMFDSEHTTISYIYKKIPEFHLKSQDIHMLKSKYDSLKSGLELESFITDNLKYQLTSEEGISAELEDLFVSIGQDDVNGESKHMIKLIGTYNGKQYESFSYLLLDDHYQLVGENHSMLISTYNELEKQGKLEDYLVEQMHIQFVNENGEDIEISNMNVDLSDVEGNESGIFKVTFKTVYQGDTYLIHLDLDLGSLFELKADAITLRKKTFIEIPHDQLDDFLLGQFNVRLVDEEGQLQNFELIEINLDHIQLEGFGAYDVLIKVQFQGETFKCKTKLSLSSSYELHASNYTMPLSKYQDLFNNGLLNDYLIHEMVIHLIDDEGKQVSVDQVIIQLYDIQTSGKYLVNIEAKYLDQVYQKDVELTITRNESETEEEVGVSYRLDAKDIEIDYKELEKAFETNSLSELIINLSEPQITKVDRQNLVEIQVDTSSIKLAEGSYRVYLSCLYQNQLYEKIIEVTVVNESKQSNNDIESELPKTGMNGFLILGIGLIQIGVLLNHKKSINNVLE